MKYSYLSLTILIAFLPAFIPTFNISSVGGKNETLFKTLNHKSSACDHSHHLNCPITHQANFPEVSPQLEFGAALGKYIRETRISQPEYQIKKVVIDPGHGGKDPGCSGVSGSKEKVIALSIALQLGKQLETYFPEVQFIFTRKTDVFVPLDKRAKIANEHNADLFISIHCNNFPKSSRPQGSETYVLGLHRAEDNLEVAKRENAAIFYEEDYKATYDGYDPNSPEGHIILSMFQNAFLEQSISFANKIEGNIVQNTQHKSRGVRQAGFLVLRETTMPSVLVETGYLSNPSDDQFLLTANGQSQIVYAITRAFAEYKSEVEGGTTAMVKPEVFAMAPVQPDRAKQIKVKTVPIETPKVSENPSPVVSPINSVKSKSSGFSNTSPSRQSLIIPGNKNSAAPTGNTISESITENPVRSESIIQYKVLLATTDNLINTDNTPWKDVPFSIQVIRDGTAYKYLATGFKSFEDAVNAKTALRKIGFDEAFLVAFQDGKRIDMKVAMNITGIK